MGYTFKNETGGTVWVRDDGGKRTLVDGAVGVIRGDEHHGAFEAAGLSVNWVQSHKEIEALAAAEDAIAAAEEVIEVAQTDEVEEAAKPKRKASVKARER